MKLTKGFTLVEMLVVLAIVAILAALAVPNFQGAIARTKVKKTSDLIAQVVAYAKTSALDKNADIYLSIQTGTFPVFCISTTSASTAGHSCDIREELVVDGVAVAITSSGGSAVSEVVFSGIYGSPSPILTYFTVTGSGLSQIVTLNMLGMVNLGAIS